MNALEFLKKHDAKPGDVLVFRYGADEPLAGVVVDQLAVQTPARLYSRILASSEPLALYRAPELWNPAWWAWGKPDEGGSEFCKLRDVSVNLIAKAEPEIQPNDLFEVGKLRRENEELKAQLAKIREAVGE